MTFTITITTDDPRAQERVEQAVHVLATSVARRLGYRLQVGLEGPNGFIRGFSQEPKIDASISAICMEGWHGEWFWHGGRQRLLVPLPRERRAVTRRSGRADPVRPRVQTFNVKFLLAVGVSPQYGQVAIWDAVSPDYPDWSGASGTVVATESCIAVATRPDWGEGGRQAVAVEVWAGSGRPTDPTLRRAFMGGLAVGVEGVCVGNVTAGQVHPLDIGVGNHLVEVWTNVALGRASVVQFRFPEPPA